MNIVQTKGQIEQMGKGQTTITYASIGSVELEVI